MTASTKPLAFAGIAERLGKLIPRLASDHDGEVVATVAAIGRTLQAAGLDWHDLAGRLAGQPIGELVARADVWPAPSRPRRQRPSPPRPRGESAPWPTWGTLSHSGRLAMLDVIVAEAAFTPAEAETMTVFRAAHCRYGSMPGQKLVRMFNVACQNLWDRGWRPEEKAA